jgi:hypothetical protein
MLAVENLVQRHSIISLICNVKCPSHILEKVGQSLLSISFWAFGYGDWK